MGGYTESTRARCVLFYPLGLMYIQAAIEKRSHYRADIIDPVVQDLDYEEFEQMLRGVNLDLVGISTYTLSSRRADDGEYCAQIIPMQRSFWVDTLCNVS